MKTGSYSSPGLTNQGNSEKHDTHWKETIQDRPCVPQRDMLRTAKFIRGALDYRSTITGNRGNEKAKDAVIQLEVCSKVPKKTARINH
jgi:hypothetical protein